MKSRVANVVVLGCLGCLVTVVSFAVPGYCQQRNKSSKLEERVEALEETVAALEKRTKALEVSLIPILKAIAGTNRRDAEPDLRDRFRPAEQPRAQPRRNAAADPEAFDLMDGNAVIVASDGEFLGKVSSNRFDSKSITNDVGQHGSNVASKSIFNNVGTYGSEVSTKSAWNDLATSPPRVFVGETFIGYLTTNELKTPRIDPHALVGYLKAKK